MKLIKSNIVVFAVLLSLYFPIYGYLSISPVLLLTIFTMPISVVSLIDNSCKFEYGVLLKIYIFIFLGLYFSYVMIGSFTQISFFLLIPLILSLNAEVLNSLKYYFQGLLFLSLLGYGLFLSGFNLDNTFLSSGRYYCTNYLTVSHYSTTSLIDLGSLRFYGFFTEPGHLGCICLIFLCHDKFKVRGNLVIWISGILSLSTAFFIISFVYILFYNYKFFFSNIIFKLLIFMVLLYSYNLFNNNQLFEYFFYKTSAFIDYEYVTKGRMNFNVNYKDDYEEILFGIGNNRQANLSSIFSILRTSGLLGLLFYISMILMLPRRYWIMLFLFSFFRYSLIFNHVFIFTLFIACSRRKITDFSIYQKFSTIPKTT